MAPDIDIVKRDGRRPSERFDYQKLYQSILAACLSVRSPEGEAEILSQTVCDNVTRWLMTKPEVTSNDLRRKATESLEQFHPEAAYFYQHHRLVI